MLVAAKPHRPADTTTRLVPRVSGPEPEAEGLLLVGSSWNWTALNLYLESYLERVYVCVYVCSWAGGITGFTAPVSERASGGLRDSGLAQGSL